MSVQGDQIIIMNILLCGGIKYVFVLVYQCTLKAVGIIILFILVVRTDLYVPQRVMYSTIRAT